MTSAWRRAWTPCATAAGASPLLPAERQSPPGSGNFRITEWQAAVLLAQLERLPEQVARREAAAAVLDDRLAELPGVAPLRRDPAITCQSYYAYGFQFIPEMWEGISHKRSAAPSAPSWVLAPSERRTSRLATAPSTVRCSKRRHRLGDDYWAAIDPAAYYLPVTDRICREEGVLVHHPLLLLPPSAMEQLGGRDREAVRAPG